jgi:Arf-GAP/SH3 domain/ANK repeat/PH domain-containing protein
LKTIEHFGSYITDLSQGLQRIRQKQDEERKQLADLRQLLKSSHVFDKEVSFLCQHLRKMYLTDSRVN